MTGPEPIPLTPEQAELRRNTVELSPSAKRDAQVGRLYDPAVWEQVDVEIPDPSARQIAATIGRLKVWLAGQGIAFTDRELTNIATSSTPWRVVRQQMQAEGSSVELDLIQDAITRLYEDTWRLSFVQQKSRGTRTGSPEFTSAAAAYVAEHDRLWQQEGLSKSQAHQLMAEWGWENPVISDPVRTEIAKLAEGLAIARATGEYTGPVEPEDLLLQPTFESAEQLLEATYTGPRPFEQFLFAAELEGAEGISDDPLIASSQSEAAEEGKPILEEVVEGPPRSPIGVPFDYVARAEPRPPGTLRGQATSGPGRGAGVNRPGLPLDDAEAFIASGPRGEDLAFAGRDFIEQEPEYFEGDDTNIFNGLSFEQTILYQTMLVDAGYLSPEDFAIEQGAKFSKPRTWDAMQKAMTASNATIAESWIEAAQEAAATRARNNAAVAGTNLEPVPVWTPATYLAPDPDTLSQIVKQAFRSQLGREPTAQEVSGLMASLSAEYRGLFDVNERVAQASFEQNIGAQEASLGPIDPLTGERVVEPLEEGETFRTVENPLGSAAGVDPIASFQEQFERMFAAELSRGRQRVTQRDARRNIMSSIFATDAAIGGGR